MTQEAKKTKVSKEFSYVLTDVSFISDAVFMGRKDSISAPYVMPSIGYYDASGFYADASLSYLTRLEERRVDLFLLTAGFHFGSEKLSGYFSGTGYFYSEESYNVQSEVIADITGSLGYDFKVLQTSILASVYFTQEGEADIFLGGSIGKLFKTVDENLHITPSIAFYGGSQNFYQEYYQSSRLGNRKGKGKGGGDIITGNIMIEEVTSFDLMSIEFDLTMDLYIKKFIFSLSPAIVFPQSPSAITTVDGMFEEDLDSAFYVSIGISYWFYTSK
ncbi:hypothetical protein DX873_14015 [Flagellimonas nanhaiensis]|uniref:Uncharacterized protein n=2 Tax=Flagellimonas nanhaiensis TaxID=2292706 RepID=A0A371JNI6_9FLAO|nr:hypothetical protein DX873_14015 [Allomuricauda nanhaiensis]